MHGHRGLSGARHSLHDGVVIGRFADNLILLLLNRGYDLAKHRLLVFGEIFREKLIICDHLAVKIIEKPSALDLVGAF